MEILEINSKNMYTSLLQMANFIKNKMVDGSKLNNLKQLQGFGKAA